MSIVLSILVLTAIALLAGAVYLWRQGGHERQALLMLVLAIVAAVNVAIWTVPDAEGTSPLQQVAEQ